MKSKKEVKKKEKFYCYRCGAEVEKHVPGIGTQCRCKNCGYKDACCD